MLRRVCACLEPVPQAVALQVLSFSNSLSLAERSMVPIARANLDTEALIPKQFFKVIVTSSRLPMAFEVDAARKRRMLAVQLTPFQQGENP